MGTITRHVGLYKLVYKNILLVQNIHKKYIGNCINYNFVISI